MVFTFTNKVVYTTRSYTQSYLFCNVHQKEQFKSKGHKMLVKFPPYLFFYPPLYLHLFYNDATGLQSIFGAKSCIITTKKAGKPKSDTSVLFSKCLIKHIFVHVRIDTMIKALKYKKYMLLWFPLSKKCHTR